MDYHLRSLYDENKIVKSQCSLKRPRSPADPESMEISPESSSSANNTNLSSAPSAPHPRIYEDSQPYTREFVIQQIEQIFASITTSLRSGSTTSLQITLAPRCRTSSSFDADTSTIRRSLSTTSNTTVCFPKDAWRFACIVKTLDIIHESLVEGRRATTKRDVFYKNPKLFRNQRVVDRIVDDLAATFRVERSVLGIVASAKGMVYGDMTIGGRHFLANGGGIVVPGELEGITVGDEVEWVLVVEKEAVFRNLACGGGKKGIFVTGKGYPDVATREVVRMLAEVRRWDGEALRMFALVDMDPHGIEIMATYRFGSMAMAWDNHRLAVRRLEWLGVKSEDLIKIIANDDIGDGEVEGVLSLTVSDRRKAVGMLEKAWMVDVPEWKEGLQNMLFLNIKAEIEIVDGVGIKNWVEGKISVKMATKR